MRLRITIMLGLMMTAGCATTIVPPTVAPDGATVYLTDYGRHSSVLLPSGSGAYSEFAFGDWNWFALSRTKTSDGLRALFFSAGATLGKRQIDLGDDVDDVARKTKAFHVAKFAASRGRIDPLLVRLNGDFEARLDTVRYNPASDLWFVRSDEPYGLLHNCNHATARWLRALGCEVRGPSVYSNFRIRGRDSHAVGPATTRATTTP